MNIFGSAFNQAVFWLTHFQIGNVLDLVSHLYIS